MSKKESKPEKEAKKNVEAFIKAGVEGESKDDE